MQKSGEKMTPKIVLIGVGSRGKNANVENGKINYISCFVYEPCLKCYGA